MNIEIVPLKPEAMQSRPNWKGLGGFPSPAPSPWTVIAFQGCTVSGF